MEKKSLFTMILAAAGTALVWFPFLALVLLSLFSLIEDRIFRFDYLIPAELFPVVVVGGGLLIWAAVRSKSHRRIIGWGMGTAVGILIFGQVFAVLTGLASGEREAAGFIWMLVVASLVIYVLAVIFTGIGGILLLRDLAQPAQSRV
jgi:hypothetical protein